MSDRRRFNTSERVALYLAADGKCSDCGTPLEPGWHADHIQPFSKGGPTDVSNGQALCPKCNQQKGNREMTEIELRRWQIEAFEMVEKKLFDQERDMALAVAPGCGKSLLALLACKKAKERGFRRIIVVVPSIELKNKFINDALNSGIKLWHADNGNGARPPRGYDGVVTTYAAVAAGDAKRIYRKGCSADTMVVLDEIHHAGDKAAWGESIQYAFEQAGFRLLMTGTPFRADGSAIPFVEYDADGKIKTDFSYTYGEAWMDSPKPIRTLQFHRQGADAQWQWKDDIGDVGDVHRLSSSEADDKTHTLVLGRLLNPDNSYMSDTIAKAHADLMARRAHTPDAAGLIVCKDQDHARRVQRLLHQVTGVNAPVVTSDETGSTEAIASFRSGTAPWIVAVKMISEGVDIPRLEVLVWATVERAELFFQQVVGRVVRRRTPNDMRAAIYIPNTPIYDDLASQLENMLAYALREKGEGSEREQRDQSDRPVLVDLGTLNVRVGDVFMPDSGSTVPGEVVAAVAPKLPEWMRPGAADVVAAFLPQLAGLSRAPEPQVTFDRAAHMRELETLSRKNDYQNGWDPGTTNRLYYKKFDGPRGDWSDEQLMQAITELRRKAA